MFKTLAPLTALALTASCVDIPLSGNAFEAATTGNTYTVQRGSAEPYGIMQFGANRQVMWDNFERDTCFAGTWSEPEPGLICYNYASPTRTVCWQNVQTGDQITLYLNGDRSDPYYYGQTTADSTNCPPPGSL